MATGRRNPALTVPLDGGPRRRAPWRFPLSLLAAALWRAIADRRGATAFQSPVSRHPTTRPGRGGRLRAGPPGGNHNTSEEDCVEGVYLDEETYLRAEDTMVRADGSLAATQHKQEESRAAAPSDPRVQPTQNDMYGVAAQGLFSPAPSYSYSNDAESQRQTPLFDEERLHETVVDIEAGRRTSDMEELHRQVFAEERAFLRQSADFRQSLSTDGENPTAQKRRQEFERHNERVLEGLMAALDEMEAAAISRDEARRRAEGSFANETTKDVVCPQCGLGMPPNMLVQMKTAEAVAGEKKSTEVGRPGAFVCYSCHRQQLQAADEAKLRFGASFESSSSTTTFNNKKWAGSKRYTGKRTKSANGRSGARGGVKGIDTSLLLNVPKGYGSEQHRALNNSNDPKKGRRRNRAGDDTSTGGSSVQGAPALVDNPEGYGGKISGGTSPKSSLEMLPGPVQNRKRVPNNSDDMNERREPDKAGGDISKGRSSAKGIPPLFDVPKRYDGERKGRATSNTSIEKLPSRTLQRLGGRELAKRMHRQRSETIGDEWTRTTRRTEHPLPPWESERKTLTEKTGVEPNESINAGVSSAIGKGGETEAGRAPFPTPAVKEAARTSSDNEPSRASPHEPWVKVEDAGSGRMFYWNTDTGEMKRTLETPAVASEVAQ